MELKRFVRRGLFNESRSYRNVLRFEDRPPGRILMLLEGRARRKLELKPGRSLYENYYPITFIGLEDELLGRVRPGAAGVYPGSHYCLWETEDFMAALGVQPELARRAIFELSRRIRIYDERSHTTAPALRREAEIEIGAPSPELADALYEMSFSDSDEFPPHLLDRFSRTFAPGSALMRQGETSLELYIIISGQVEVFRTNAAGERIKIDELGQGDLVGEMAQFDGLPRSADVIAARPTVALALEPSNFHVLFQLHPRWSMKLLQTLAERLEQRRRDLETIDPASIRSGDSWLE